VYPYLGKTEPRLISFLTEKFYGKAKIMEQKDETITKKEAHENVQRALRRGALIYHYFCETLAKEFGQERGRELIRKAVGAYGERIGQDARKKAQEKGLALSPENFESDLPDDAWKTEVVVVDGEERVRVYYCPLASEWLTWGDPEMARLYCYVDQAKMEGFNPEYEYIHVKNLLDGDPFCELVVRKKTDTHKTEVPEADAKDTVSWVYGKYTREDLMVMDPVCLRALFRERVHHTIEVDIYPIVLGQKKAKSHIGREPEMILDVWRQRGFPEDEPDLEWGKKYISYAQRLREGEKVEISGREQAAFNPEEMETVKKLIWERRSVRDWIPGKKIPDKMISQVLEAGRAAPTGCNLDIVRFVVIKDPEEAKMVWSDIPTPMDRSVLIVLCYDKRVYRTVGHDRLVPHNQLLDCAAAADHMCLMAHALGLGAVWLTRTDKTARTFKEQYGLPEYIEPALHMALGWPAIGTIKSARMPLKEMVISKGAQDKT
jgi:nitroreductase